MLTNRITVLISVLAFSVDGLSIGSDIGGGVKLLLKDTITGDGNEYEWATKGSHVSIYAVPVDSSEMSAFVNACARVQGVPACTGAHTCNYCPSDFIALSIEKSFCGNPGHGLALALGDEEDVYTESFRGFCTYEQGYGPCCNGPGSCNSMPSAGAYAYCVAAASAPTTPAPTTPAPTPAPAPSLACLQAQAEKSLMQNKLAVARDRLKLAELAEEAQCQTNISNVEMSALDFGLTKSSSEAESMDVMAPFAQWSDSGMQLHVSRPILALTLFTITTFSVGVTAGIFAKQTYHSTPNRGGSLREHLINE